MLQNSIKIYYIGKENELGAGAWEIQGIFLNKETGIANMKDDEFMCEIDSDTRLPGVMTTPSIYWWKFDGVVTYYNNTNEKVN